MIFGPYGPHWPHWPLAHEARACPVGLPLRSGERRRAEMATLTQPGMDKCGDNVDTKFCYEPHGDRGYVVYNDYKPCMESWILLPGFELLPREFVATVYFFFLVYLFLGISILSDVFMNAIEVITAKKRTLKRIDAKTQQSVEVEVDVWNATVANLTLLALGSSAPEILLSLIETMTTLGSCDSQNPGELGAATIVGSASFNLLAISAVCMVSVPDGEVRKITEFSVFLTTAVFSLFAYIWVFFVYEWSSKEVIDLWEALITLGLFPCLIIAAYGVDRGWFSFGTKVGDVESGKQDKLERVMYRLVKRRPTRWTREVAAHALNTAIKRAGPSAANMTLSSL